MFFSDDASEMVRIGGETVEGALPTIGKAALIIFAPSAQSDEARKRVKSYLQDHVVLAGVALASG